MCIGTSIYIYIYICTYYVCIYRDTWVHMCMYVYIYIYRAYIGKYRDYRLWVLGVKSSRKGH